MGLRATFPGFLLSSAAAIAAANIWGTAGLVPFTVGEVAGAAIALFVLGSSASNLLRVKRSPVVRIRRHQPQCDIDAPKGPAPVCARCQSNAQVIPLTGFVGTARREGQVSPYFPGVRAWLYTSCPPMRRSMPARKSRRVEAPNRLVIDVENYKRAADCMGLLPSHFPTDRTRLS